MSIDIINPKKFLQSILVNTDHTLATLSEILDIPLKNIITNQFTENDFINMKELKTMIISTKCDWIR